MCTRPFQLCSWLSMTTCHPHQLTVPLCQPHLPCRLTISARSPHLPSPLAISAHRLCLLPSALPQITEYAEPYQQTKTAIKKDTHNSQFLDSFFTTPYPQITQKPM